MDFFYLWRNNRPQNRYEFEKYSKKKKPEVISDWAIIALNLGDHLISKQRHDAHQKFEE